MTTQVPDWSQHDLESAVVRAKGYVPVGVFGVVVQDRDGAIVATTPAAEEILGVSAEQMSHHSSRDPLWWAVSFDGQPLPIEAHPAMITLRTGRAQIGVILGVYGGSGPAGTYAWITVDSFPLARDQMHLPGDVIACLTPVEGARADELRVAQSERMFRAITERSQELVGIHSLEGRWLWASPAARTVLGYEPTELLGANMFEVVHPDDLDHGYAALADVLLDNGPVTVAVRANHKLGHTIWVEVIGQLITNDAGLPFQIQTSTRDVTPRIVAEQARDAAVEVFTSVMENSPIGMALQDLDGVVRTSNRALQEMLHCAEDDLVGSVLVDRVHPDDRGWVAAAVADVIAGDQSLSRREARFELPDGSSIWVESSTVVLRAFDGTPTGFLEQLHDVTARKHAEADLERRATSDPLTGLPNRTRFLDLLADAIDTARAADHQIAVLFLDLDGFKSVNDTYGHDVGDDLLREVADRLTAALGAESATRYGGDEFVAMCRGVDGASLDAAVETVIGVLDEPFVVDEVLLAVTASIGRATGVDKRASDLLREADRAMYLAKRERAT